MLKIYIILCVLCSTVICQDWASRTCMVNPLGYYTKVMQATVSEMENDIKWSNFKLDDLSIPVDFQLYNWHAVGNVNFTNGFLVSVERVDITNFLASMGPLTVNGVQNTVATLRGNFNLNQAKVGFDVDIDYEGHDKTRVTGVFIYRIVSWTYNVARNLHTNETTVTITTSSNNGASPRMEFLPNSNLTEVASRVFFAYSTGNTMSRWGREITQLILKHAQAIEFPEIRFDNNC